MPGMSDLLAGGAGGPMDLRSLAGQMGMGAQQATTGGPVQGMGPMPPGGMDMMAQMGGPGGPMGGGPPPPGPMGGPGQMNPMLAQLLGQPPQGISPESSTGLEALLQFSDLEDEEIIELVVATKPPAEIIPTLVAIGEQLNRPGLLEAAQMLGGAGPMEPELQPTGEGMMG